MDREFVQARIDATKAQIVATEDAVLALTTGQVLSYSLDTGQTRQTVTKQDLVRLQGMLDGLYNRLETLCARLNGGSVNLRPDW